MSVFFVSKVKLPYRKGKHAEKETPMQFRNMRSLYNADSTEGTTTTTQTDTQQQQNGNEEKPKLFTQEELSKVAAKEAREAKAKAEKAILEALGLSTVDEVKAIVEAKRKADESAKTAEEKLREELAQKDKELLEAKQKAEQAEKRRLEAVRDNAIRNALSDAHDSESTLLVFQSKNAAAIDGLLDESGNVDTKELDKLVAEFRAKNGYLFKGNAKGSPSNADGRFLKPTGEIEKEARAEIKRKFNF